MRKPHSLALAGMFQTRVAADVSRRIPAAPKMAPTDGRVAQRNAAKQSKHAKRLECAELAPAFAHAATSESGSKLRALQTLRDFGSRRGSRQPALSWATLPDVGGYAPSRRRNYNGTSARVAWLGLLLSVALAFFVGCGKKHEPQAATGESLPPASVRVQTIEAVKQPAVEEVVGTVQPKLQAVIEAKASGRITRLPVTLGQSVKQGDVLVELATQEIQARLDQANAAFRQAELDFNRTDNLRKQQAATQAELDAAQARFTVAKATVAEADALSGYAKILAPFDGVVARKLADEGDMAMPGKPLLELEGRAGLRLVADIPSLLAGRVLPGAKLAVRVDTLPHNIMGTVVEISPAADPASRTVCMKLDLPETAGLRTGQFGRLAVPIGETTFLFVPPSALVRRGQLEILFVAADGKAQMRLVRAGKETPQGIEILSGLTAGEAVVIEGAGTLRDGQPLQTH